MTGWVNIFHVNRIWAILLLKTTKDNLCRDKIGMSFVPQDEKVVQN